MPVGTRRVACVVKTPQPCTPFGTHARNPRDSRALPVPVRVSQGASLRAEPFHRARGGFMPARSAPVHRLDARAHGSGSRPLSELGVRSSGRCRTAGRSPAWPHFASDQAHHRSSTVRTGGSQICCHHRDTRYASCRPSSGAVGRGVRAGALGEVPSIRAVTIEQHVQLEAGAISEVPRMGAVAIGTWRGAGSRHR